MAIHETVHEGCFSISQEKQYIHLPFEIPPDTQRIDIEFEYSGRISSDPTLTGGNTIDLGIFDERGAEFLTAGFRGWSGSERLQMFISENDATPGYLPGPLNPGQWNLLLGLYKIAESGCNYRAVMRAATAPGHAAAACAPASVGELPASPPTALHGGWLRGEIHCHTWHSDGELPPHRLLELARARGLDFLAVTDHNTTACQTELARFTNPGLILIRGVESTTFKGHFNVWGIPDWVDFRVETPQQLEAALEFANQRGALTCCNHPKPFGPNWDFRSVSNFTCVEVWNGPWSGLNYISLNYWLEMLNAGMVKPAVGGSDFHRPGELEGPTERNLGTPTTWVYLDGPPNAQNILAAMRAGRVSISDTPNGPLLELRAGAEYAILQGGQLAPDPASLLPARVRCLRGRGCTLQLLDQQAVLAEWVLASDDELCDIDLSAADHRYIRAELKDQDGRMRALSNPVYFTMPA